MEYLSSIQKKYKPEYKKIKIPRIRNSFQKLAKDFKELNERETKVKNSFIKLKILQKGTQNFKRIQNYCKPNLTNCCEGYRGRKN